jgi:peptidoglycan/LPS O-acetylase OafA/YrhL
MTFNPGSVDAPAIVRFEDEGKPDGDKRRRWSGLDGLRALAVAVVVANHFGLHSNGGIVGVDVFFVISGFLITSLLLDEGMKTGGISFRKFWARRGLRLFPALACAIVFALVMSLAATAIERHQTVVAVPFVVLYVGNWFLVFGHDHSLGLLGPTWSLAIEEQFYVVWPLVAAFWLAKTAHRFRAAVIVAVISALAAVWALVAQDVLHIGYVYFRTDTHAMGLLAGSALALLLSSSRTFEPGRRLAVLLRTGSIAGIIVILALTVGVRYNINVEILAVVVTSVASVVVVAQLVLVPSGWPNRIFEHRVATWLGRRSYGIYLYNYPITVIFLQNDRAHGLHRLLVTVLGLAAIVAIAALSYRWVEQPFLRRKDRFRPLPPGPLVEAT